MTRQQQIIRTFALSLGLVGFVGLAACDNDNGNNGGGNQSAGVNKFNRDGPAAVRRVSAGGFTLFLGNGGGAKPGFTWANGTGGSPGTYVGILTRVASFGTQVVASNSPNTGTGQAVADGVGVLRNADGSVTRDFCTSGHSQGGSGSVNAARIITQRGTATVRCTIPVEPDTRFTANSNGRDIQGNGLILCGTADTLAPCNGTTSNGNGLFTQSNRPTCQVRVVGAGHVGAGSPTGNGGLFSALVTAGVEAAIDRDPDAIAAVARNNPTTAGDGRFTGVRCKGF